MKSCIKIANMVKGTKQLNKLTNSLCFCNGCGRNQVLAERLLL